MEVHLTPDTAKRLKDLAATSGRAAEEIVEDACLRSGGRVTNRFRSRF